MEGKTRVKRRRRVKKDPSPDNEDIKQEEKPPRPRSYGERRILEEFPKIDYLTYGECLGFGHFSHVYEGTYKGEYPAAIKIIERGSEKVVEKEIGLLLELKGCRHIVQLYEVIHAESTLLVFELLKGKSAEEFLGEVTVDRMRFVLRCLLEALSDAHAKRIAHRDLKLGNILVSHDWSDVKLIDWGCGSYIKDELSPKAGSRTIRSPEMLLGSWRYGEKCDTWALGAFIFFVLCGGEVPWKAKTAPETITLMSKYIGATEVFGLAEKYDCEIADDVVEAIKAEKACCFKDAYSRKMKHLRDPQLIELMHWLLTADPELRPTAEEALKHTFFLQ